MAEVQPADPLARRLALTLVAVGFVVAALLLWGLNAGGPAIADWLRAEPSAIVFRARMLLLTLAIIMVGPPVGAGVYLWRFGSRVVSSNRFPPPGTRLVQDMLVLTGAAAQSRGRLARGAGFILIAAGCVMAVLLWRLGASVAGAGQ